MLYEVITNHILKIYNTKNMNNKFWNIKKVVSLSAGKKQALWNSIEEKITFFEKNVIINNAERRITSYNVCYTKLLR